MSESAGLVGGRYRLVKTIGSGGMGTVWQAHDEVLGRDVALKEIHPPHELDGPERDEFNVRTFREARAAGRVAHPGVAAVYDVLEEHGHPWIVMQLIPSRTLGELVRDQGPLSPTETAAIGVQLLEALRAAHAAGVLHRDVKPDNVLLTDSGRAVLTDFGIATTEDEAPVTRTGILVGTPAFMAPERAAGGRAHAASDLWSVGVTLYVAIEGRSPFQRPHALATLGAVMHSEPDPMARAGVLAPVVLGLLRKNPAERLSLDEAERQLHAIMTGAVPEPTAPLDVPSPVPARPAGPNRRMPLAVLAAGAIVVALTTGGMAWLSHRDSGARPPASTPTGSPTAMPSSSGPTPAPMDPTPERTVTTPGDRRVRNSGPPSGSPKGGPESSGPRQETTRKPSREPTRKPAPTKSTSDDDQPASRTPGQVDPSDNGRKNKKPKKKDKKDKKDG